VLGLDNHPRVGGEAKRNEFDVDGVRLIGPQGSNDFGTRLRSGWAGEYWNDLGLPSGSESFEYQVWGEGVKPLEIPRDHYYHQLWADEFERHGFSSPSLTVVR
jgi:spermidine dehydrogenase